MYRRFNLISAGGLLALLALLLAGPASAQLESIDLSDASVRYSEADEHGRYVHLIEFQEPGLIERFRQVRSAGERFSVDTPQMQSALAELQDIQQQRIQVMNQALGRELEVTHYYPVTHSGIATRLSREEADVVRRQPGVVAVERERVYDVETFRGPEFIGAGALWDGSASPSGPLLGENMVAAILDTGVVTGHPSFANDTVHCDHGVNGTPDKLLSALDCATATGPGGMCNGPDPEDGNDHGSHVSSTVAGNRLDPSSPAPAPPVEISGVAPCAHVRSYRVCPSSCPGAQIQAGMTSILVHGDVDVMNFSISGGRSPWGDNDRRKLDLVDAGVFVAAAAGNTSDGVPNPFGQVNHLGPWVMSVANTTHDGLLGHSIDVDGGPSNIAGLPGTGPALTTDFNGQLRWAGDVDGANVEGCSAFPAGAFAGEAALIIRGTCNFSVKVDNAVAAGAGFVIVYNNAPGAPIVMGALGGTAVPSVMVTQADGEAIIVALDGDTADLSVAAALTAFGFPGIGDVLSGGSLVGPSPTPFQNIQKPDIAAPGTNIFAAGRPVSNHYRFMSGTSMASPHLAGAAVLVHQARPGWTPVEVKSALTMAASGGGFKPNGVTPWDADDVGSGRTQVDLAANAGLVMPETFANFLGANPGTGGDPRTLNLPALRDLDCSPSCSFTRTVRNTLDVPTEWSVNSSFHNGNFNVEVVPDSFSFGGGLAETQVLAVTVTPVGDQTGAIGFGDLVFTEDGGLSPALLWTLAFRGAEGLPPQAQITPDKFDFLLEEDGSNSGTLNIANLGGADLTYSIDEAAPFSVMLGGSTRGGGPAAPIDLVIDNGIATIINVPNQQWLWFNRFTPGVLDLPFTLEQVSVAFAPGNGGVLAGHLFDVHVWVDADGDPTTGATLVASVTGQTITAGVNFQTVVLPAGGVPIDASSGDVLIGVVNRTTGDPYAPAVADSPGASQERSWAAFNFPGGVAANPPVITGAATLVLIDDLLPGRNWTIRGFGTGGSACLAPSDVSWLTVTPDAGTVAGGSNQEVEISVDMTGLGTGTFEARLCIETNDAGLPVKVVPITVEVVDEILLPQAQVTPSSFSFVVDTLSTDDDDLVIANNGEATLLWDLFDPFDIPILPTGGGPEVHIQEDFSDAAFPPAGWSRHLITGSAAVQWNRSTAQFNSAPAAALRGWTSGAQEDWLVMPAVSLGGEPVLRFIDAGQWMVDYVYSGVWASTGSCDPTDGDFVEVAEIPDTPGQSGTFTWRSAPLELDLGAFAGQTVCLAFRYEGDFAHAWVIDDVLLTSVPQPCYDPDDVTWLSVSATGGSVDPLDQQLVNVEVSGNGLLPGLHETRLCVFTNDPANPLFEVPVSLEVTLSEDIFADGFESP